MYLVTDNRVFQNSCGLVTCVCVCWEMTTPICNCSQRLLFSTLPLENTRMLVLLFICHVFYLNNAIFNIACKINMLLFCLLKKKMKYNSVEVLFISITTKQKCLLKWLSCQFSEMIMYSNFTSCSMCITSSRD